MNISLSSHRLLLNGGRKIHPGTKVCSTNGSYTVGVIVDVGKLVPHVRRRMAPEFVSVLWGTGKKRGKIETKLPENLINYDSYFAAIQEEYKRLDGLNEEVKTVGL